MIKTWLKFSPTQESVFKLSALMSFSIKPPPTTKLMCQDHEFDNDIETKRDGTNSDMIRYIASTLISCSQPLNRSPIKTVAVDCINIQRQYQMDGTFSLFLQSRKEAKVQNEIGINIRCHLWLWSGVAD